jgi:aminoacrylate peracid reductase
MNERAGEVVTAGPWPPRYTFSPAVRAGNLLFISGTTAVDDDMQIVGPGDIAAQARHIFAKFERLLAAAGATLADIVETTDFITTTENYAKTAEVRRQVFRGGPYPAATGVVVAGLLRPGALIEISAVAVIPPSAPSAASTRPSAGAATGTG